MRTETGGVYHSILCGLSVGGHTVLSERRIVLRISGFHSDVSIGGILLGCCTI